MPPDRFDRLREALEARRQRFMQQGKIAKAAEIEAILDLMRRIK